jgi:hypothetical protein
MFKGEIGRAAVVCGLGFAMLTGCSPADNHELNPVAPGLTTDHVRVVVEYNDETPVEQAEIDIMLLDLDNDDPVTGQPWVRREIHYLTGRNGAYDRYVSYRGQGDEAADEADIAVHYNHVLIRHDRFEIRDNCVVAVIRMPRPAP